MSLPKLVHRSGVYQSEDRAVRVVRRRERAPVAMHRLRDNDETIDPRGRAIGLLIEFRETQFVLSMFLDELAERPTGCVVADSNAVHCRQRYTVSRSGCRQPRLSDQFNRGQLSVWHGRVSTLFACCEAALEFSGGECATEESDRAP